MVSLLFFVCFGCLYVGLFDCFTWHIVLYLLIVGLLVLVCCAECGLYLTGGFCLLHDTA